MLLLLYTFVFFFCLLAG